MEESENVARIVRTTTEVSPETRAIQRELEMLTMNALQQARDILDFGLADQKIAIIRTILSGTMKIVGSDVAVVEEEARVAIDSIWNTMRNVPNVTTPSIAPRAYHPDEIPHD